MVYEQLNLASIVMLIIFVTGLARILDLSLSPAYSDTMTGGALSQRIGGFDVELKTIPSTPLSGDKTNIFARIGTIDGNDAIDTPITISIKKQGYEVYKSNTIIVPNGHYTYPYRFAESGIYGIYILVHDLSAIGETRIPSTSSSYHTSSQSQDILFTFPVNVQSRSGLEFSGVQIVLLILAGVAAVCAIIVFYLRVKKNRGERSFRPTRLT